MEFAKFGVKVVTVQPGDFSKATNLLTNHHRNMNQMWGEMTDINRQEYKQVCPVYLQHKTHFPLSSSSLPTTTRCRGPGSRASGGSH